MGRIVPKLNLNKTPQLVENNSLVMAKNIRLLEDGTIGPDTSLQDIKTEIGDINTEIVHHDAVTDDVKQYYFLDEKDEKKLANCGRIASTELIEAID